MERIEMKKNCVIILAGGQGSRFKKQKQFVKIKDKELWKYVYDKVSAYIDPENIVVVGVDVEGGATRSGSVMNGLNYFKNDFERVVILESARPMVTEIQIKELLESTEDSVTFVAPSVDTIIMKDKTYLNRSECLRLLTPQAFNFKLLKQAYQSNKYEDMTDETRVMYEEFGIKASFLEGGDNLFKVTYPSDIYLVENLLK